MEEKMKKGQIQIGLLVGGASLIAAIVAPVLWISNGSAAQDKRNAIQDEQIKTFYAQFEAVKEQFKDMKTEYKEMGNKIDALLINNGLNPKKFENTND